MAKVDLALGNDVTSPIAIKAFRAAGAKKVFDREKIALVADHFTPNKDIASAEQVKAMREFAGAGDRASLRRRPDGIEHVLLTDVGSSAGDCDRGGQPNLHYGALCAFSRGSASTDLGPQWSRRRCGEGPRDAAERPHGAPGEMGRGEGRHPSHHREDRGGRRAVPGHGVRRGRGGAPADGVAVHHDEHGDRGGRQERDLPVRRGDARLRRSARKRLQGFAADPGRPVRRRESAWTSRPSSRSWRFTTCRRTAAVSQAGIVPIDQVVVG